MKPFKPSKEELNAAFGKAIPDIIAPGLTVLFCGINPGLYSGATGCHFARPGNRFWKSLHLSGFMDRQLSPFEGEELLKLKIGITNVVNKTTARADELTPDDYIQGGKDLERKVLEFKPKVLAVLGIGAFRSGFNKPKILSGLQDEKIGETHVWVLPNPSGLNAHFQSADFTKLFKELLEFVNSLGT